MDIPLQDRWLRLFVAQARRKQLEVDDYFEDLLSQLADRITSQENFLVSVEDKLSTSDYILRHAFSKVRDMKQIGLAWTGGKDSTVVLWLIKRLVKQQKLEWPMIILIDEGDMFNEVKAFCRTLAKEWKFDYLTISNDDILSLASSSKEILVEQMNERNQRELKRLGYEHATWKLEPESEIGNHLMKTVVQNVYLEQTGISHLITGIRWDEQAARADEHYFSPRGDEFTPAHMRVHPLLHFREKDIWEAIKLYSLPYVSLYEEGYRSLGAKSTTNKIDSKPAWEQDLEHTTERGGRAQDKENVMERLRKLGYM